MSTIERISLYDVLGPYKFYDFLLDEINKYTLEDSDSELVIDFCQLESISPLVIPNFLNLGYLLQQGDKLPTQLFIPWRPDFIKYLSNIKFIELTRKFHLYRLDDRYLGGLPNEDKIHERYKTLFIDENLIFSQLFSNHIADISEILKDIIADEYAFLNITDNIEELLENASKHRKTGLCFATFQANKKQKTFKYSISDSGIGYYESFKGKIRSGFQLKIHDTKKFLELEENNHPLKNFFAIIEAVFWRKKIFKDDKEYEYGIYDVVKSITNESGIVRIHSGDIQVIFTEKNFSSYFDKDLSSKDIIKKLEIDFISKYRIYNKIYSPIRKNSYDFRGVHIEIELPILS